MNQVKVSVVMSVYNDADVLERTIQSVLSQTMPDFEFIIVNDGSTDHTQEILDVAKQAEPRISIVEQAKQGLTQALITGCQQATAEFIARHDNGDISAPDRLAEQLKHLEQNHNTVMVSCGTVFTGPKGESLYEVIQSKQDSATGLKQNSIETLKGPPHHGSVMFRHDTYSKVGGYRSAFTVAQDIDLWTRLVEHGEHHSLPKVLYQAAVAKNSISMLRREQQLLATQAIIDCRTARRTVGNDQAAIESYQSQVIEASKESPMVQSSPKTDADYYYFVASNLYKTNVFASREYLQLTLQHNHWHVKAWIKLFSCNIHLLFKRISKA